MSSASTEMRVARIGFTPLKGGRHLSHPSVQLTEAGPLGDRAFCLVDPALDRCLRTVGNPSLVATRTSWDGVVLSVELPTGRAVGEPVPTGDVRRVDYWGRTVSVQVVEGPWAAAFSAYLGRDVVLAASAPGEVVYGEPVSLVTSTSLARLGEEVGAPVDGARFRATFELECDDLAPFGEDDWVGRRLRLGDAEVRVRSVVPRCPVIDLHPEHGVADLALLKALAGSRQGMVGFGVDAEVTAPGKVSTEDPCRLS